MVNLPGNFVDRPDMTAPVTAEVVDVGSIAAEMGKSPRLSMARAALARHNGPRGEQRAMSG